KWRGEESPSVLRRRGCQNTNIEIKTVVSQEVSEAIFSGLVEYQANHALIAFRQNVEALTGFEII
ncbi:MAG: hypothetical protein ACOVO7_08165, partial [Microcystis aeruginosa]